MKIAAAPRAAARSNGPGFARSGDSFASIGRPGFMRWSSPGSSVRNLGTREQIVSNLCHRGSAGSVATSPEATLHRPTKNDYPRTILEPSSTSRCSGSVELARSRNNCSAGRATPEFPLERGRHFVGQLIPSRSRHSCFLNRTGVYDTARVGYSRIAQTRCPCGDGRLRQSPVERTPPGRSRALSCSGGGHPERFGLGPNEKGTT